MIKNDQQLKDMEARIGDLKASLTLELSDVPADLRPSVLDQKRMLIQQYELEITEYLLAKTEGMDC